ncbi:MAG: DUF3142 domain-containing protein [Alphaproteobacteria bacterium]|nr:DUF3142 domain-containing protein [Alphaproteobacteria bacterium]
MRRRLGLWVSLLLVAGLTSSNPSSSSPPTPHPLTDDAYVWQRRWTPAVAGALAASAERIASWRVLAAQARAGGSLAETAFDAAALAGTARPVIAVVRLDGRLLLWDPQTLLGDLQALVARWRSLGVALAGVEIDHDCGTAQLPGYARFLEQARAVLPTDLRLSITALPAWLSAPALDAVLAAADEAVLQVHAVEHPRAGLIDHGRALAWAQTFDRRTPKPFRVALPTYGSRVAWDDDGTIHAVESEAPLLAPQPATELMASPVEMAALRHDLAAARLRHLVGVAWFRLPTDADRRAWSVATFHAVLDGRPLAATLDVVSAPTDTPALRTLLLVNAGDADATLPRLVRLPVGCALADGIGPYRLERDAAGMRLMRVQTGLLHGRHAVTIGWMRCAGDTEGLHAEP